MRPRFKKILKYTFRGILFLLLLVILTTAGLYFYLKTDSGKKWVTAQLSSFLQKQTGAGVELELAEVSLPNTLVLHNMRVTDHKGNEMLLIPRLYARFGYYNLVSGKITISRAEIDSMDFHLLRYEGDSMSNFSYVLHRLTDSPGGGGGSTQLVIKSVQLNHLDFNYDNFNEKPDTTMVDFEHIDIKDFNTDISFLEVDGPRFGALVKGMNFSDRSGFVLNDLRANFTYTDTLMEFKDLYLLTPQTELRDYLRFDYKTVDNFNEFIDSVKMDARLSYSKASFKDIAFFTHQLQNKTDQVRLSGDVKGSVSNMKIKGLRLAFGNYSLLEGGIELKGLPNLDETFIAADIKQAITSRKELNRAVPELSLPEELGKLGIITFNADFTGFINDFVAYGNFDTELGKIRSDINLKLSEKASNTRYSGSVKLDKFNMGKMVDEPLLGIISMESSEIEGRGVSLDNIEAKLKASISRFDFKGYPYNDLKVNGNINGKLFNGQLTVNDTNLNLDFKGYIDFNRQKPEFNFTADIGHARLKRLHLTEDSLKLDTRLTMHTNGVGIDNIEGLIVAHNTRFSTPGRVYVVDSLVLVSLIDDHYREINIFSDFVMGQLKGDFKVSQLPDLVKGAARQYMDSGYVRINNEGIADQYVDFNIQFRNISPLTTLLKSDLQIKDSGYVRGSIDMGRNYLRLDSKMPGISYGDYHFNDLALNGVSKGSELDLKVTAGSFILKDTMLLKDIKIDALSNNDRLAFKLYTTDQLNEKEIWLNGSLDVDAEATYLALDPSQLRVLDTMWDITARRITMYGDTLVEFPLITLRNGTQGLKVIGKYGTTTDYPIRLILENIDLPMLYAFVPEIKGFKGKINGQVLLSELQSTPVVEAATFISPLVYENDTMGILSAVSHYNQKSRKLQIDANLQNLAQDEVVTAKGSIDFAKGQELDIDLALNKTELKLLEPLMVDVFKDMTGLAYADMKLSGTLGDPLIKGRIRLQDAYLTVSYLNTRYHFSHNFSFDGKNIDINDLHLYDVNERLAMIDNSQITINNFNDIRLKLYMEAYDLQVMNTTLKNNELFYGLAYASGKVSITGPLDNLYFDIKMATARNTDISIPISEGNTFYGHDYISFIDKNNYLKTNRNLKLSGLSLNMDLEVTPDAYVHLIFDPRVGDVIDARGSGNIRMDITTEGDFKMYGTYALTDGNYRFTAYDVINKNFIIKSGSTIKWSGSPYEADLDVSAAYVINNVSLRPLLPASMVEEEKQVNYPVEATLKLKGSLYSPDIKLGFDIKQLNANSSSTNSSLTDVQNVLRTIKADEQEVNKQVVSLLVLQQFAPVSSGIGAGNAIGSGLNTGVGDLVSNQINYWLSKVSEDVQVGVDYRNQQEITVRVNTVLFNQRVNVGGSYDVTNSNYNGQLSYRIKEDGSLQGKAFGRTNNNPLYGQNSSTVGIGITFRREFETLPELIKRKKEEPKPVAVPENNNNNSGRKEIDAVTDAIIDAINQLGRKENQ